MLERRDFLLTDRGTDRDREVAGGIQHQAAALVAGLQAASTGGLYSSHATKLKFTGPSCDVNSLIRRGTKTRAGHLVSINKSETVFCKCVNILLRSQFWNILKGHHDGFQAS